MSLHSEFQNAILMVREALGNADIGHFHLSITADGRTETGCDNIRIEYKAGEGSYASESVTGDCVEACVREFLRRKGWKDAHEPLRLFDARSDHASV